MLKYREGAQRVEQAKRTTGIDTLREWPDEWALQWIMEGRKHDKCSRASTLATNRLLAADITTINYCHAIATTAIPLPPPYSQ